ncbi:MAG: radical SAM protein [Bacteroidales bacterium]|nr:radical SAM protein [Bacteroidales bacterium]
MCTYVPHVPYVVYLKEVNGVKNGVCHKKFITDNNKYIRVIRHYNIPIFIPERACPFQCIYCNQQKITGQDTTIDYNDIVETINSYLLSIPEENSEIQIAFFGGTFTAMPINEQIEFLKLTQAYIKSGKIKGIRISTRPDNIDQNILNILKKYGVSHIELGAQSLDNDVLLKSHRGHDYNAVKNASKLILQNKFTLGLQMMLGLPGDSLDIAKETAKKIIDIGAHETRIYPTLVIKDTSLHTLFNRGNYSALTTSEAIIQSAEIYKIFEKGNVKVLRIGLYPDDNLIENEVVAGPDMYNFKEKVMTEVWRQQLENLIDKTSLEKSIKIYVSPKQLNFAIGYQASNRKFLFDSFKRVKFYSNSKINNLEYHVDYY